jgi:hypothetical protein
LPERKKLLKKRECDLEDDGDLKYEEDEVRLASNKCFSFDGPLQLPDHFVRPPKTTPTASGP